MEDDVCLFKTLLCKLALTDYKDGPVFYEYFLEQNQAIAKGSSHGYQLNFETLGVSSTSTPMKWLRLTSTRLEMVS